MTARHADVVPIPQGHHRAPGRRAGRRVEVGCIGQTGPSEVDRFRRAVGVETRLGSTTGKDATDRVLRQQGTQVARSTPVRKTVVRNSGFLVGGTGTPGAGVGMRRWDAMGGVSHLFRSYPARSPGNAVDRLPATLGRTSHLVDFDVFHHRPEHVVVVARSRSVGERLDRFLAGTSTPSRAETCHTWRQRPINPERNPRSPASP